METIRIINGRISGTRVTVYDIVHYQEAKRSPAEIAQILPLTEDQVLGALKYIEENKAEVMAVHHEIEERNARGNPPAIEEMRKGSQAKMQAWLNERRRIQNQEGKRAGHTGRR